MRLKSLKLHGFKSFANRTEFEFHPGVTGVVGPNGCGKSNVVDAIRWVLGETSAKALRGGEMADVIFNGTDKRKPVGMAEVTLTLSDCEDTLGLEFNEVALTRRVFRDGKSEYRLNGNICRLKDIHELLMDTGIGRTAYSIMEQGKIDLLLSSRPEDRRTVFEEAAGITKFKSQKKEALRKLDYTEANLLRVTDIIEEVKRQINSLNRQASKARRYQELLVDVKTLDTHFSHRKFEEFDAERSELSTSIQSLSGEITESQNSISEKEQAIINARNSLSSLERDISKRREQLIDNQNKINSSKSRIEFNNERQTELNNLITQNSEDISKTQETLSKEKTDLDSTSESLLRITENLDHQKQQLRDHEKKTAELREKRSSLELNLQEISESKANKLAQLAKVKAESGSFSSMSETDNERINQIVGQITGISKEHTERQTEFFGVNEEMSIASESLQDLETKLSLAEKEFQNAINQKEILNGNLSQFHRELAKKESRLQVLKALLVDGEGLGKGTQAVLDNLKTNTQNQFKAYGLLSSFIEVESDYIPAIEAALGSHLQSILVSDEAIAENAIEILSKNRLGRASIVPENFVAPPSARQLMTLPTGVEAWAIDKVRSTETVSSLIEQLLENTFIVKDIKTAIALRKDFPSYSFATLDGNIINSNGFITGGAGESGEASSLLARLNEIKELETETSTLNDNLGEHQMKFQEIEILVNTSSKKVDTCRIQLQTATITHSTLEGKKSLLEREREGLESKLLNMQQEQNGLLRRQENAETKLQSLKNNEQDLNSSIESLNLRISEIESSAEEAKRQETDSIELLSELRTAMAVEEKAQQSLQEQKAPITERMSGLESAISRRASEVTSYKERIEQSKAENLSFINQISSLNQQLQNLDTALEEVTNQRENRAENVSNAENELRDTRQQIAKLTEQKGKEEVKKTQIDLRIESLCSTIRQRYNIDLDHFSPDSHTLLCAIEDQKKSRSLREKRRADREAKLGSDVDADQENDQNIDEQENSNTQSIPQIPGEDQPDWDFVESVIDELKQKLDSMGPVNIEAIEEFESLQERYDFLNKEHNDLTSSKESLHKVINKINRETKTRFADTFEEIRKNFNNVFKELFGESARANLIMLDESDPLESGIDIIAKPPGKKPQSITLLSGGERALTAVAILFSIYMVKPSPFCVLDELDAPLDESNIGRFLKLLDKFTKESQFVIVTHNKRTMSRCEVMYGVTQEEFGISQLIGMKFTTNAEIETSQPTT
ncbi:MAG: chromosome segregation protein SMC [Verrucomicrobiales bacterium]|nr:chromosome segregation protein SMC [Verrucomicrobiales bacterium]